MNASWLHTGDLSCQGGENGIDKTIVGFLARSGTFNIDNSKFCVAGLFSQAEGGTPNPNMNTILLLAQTGWDFECLLQHNTYYHAGSQLISYLHSRSQLE